MLPVEFGGPDLLNSGAWATGDRGLLECREYNPCLRRPSVRKIPPRSPASINQFVTLTDPRCPQQRGAHRQRGESDVG